MSRNQPWFWLDSCGVSNRVSETVVDRGNLPCICLGLVHSGVPITKVVKVQYCLFQVIEMLQISQNGIPGSTLKIFIERCFQVNVDLKILVLHASSSSLKTAMPCYISCLATSTWHHHHAMPTAAEAGSEGLELHRQRSHLHHAGPSLGRRDPREPAMASPDRSPVIAPWMMNGVIVIDMQQL